MTLGCSSVLDITIVLDGSIGHSDWYGTGRSMAIGYQRCRWWQLRPGASKWLVVTTQTRDIRIDPHDLRNGPHHQKAQGTQIHVVSETIFLLEINMASGGAPDHRYLYGLP